jgi:hypothetical protein
VFRMNVAKVDRNVAYVAMVIHVLPLSLKASISRIRTGQTFLSLTNFIEKRNNIYDIK